MNANSPIRQFVTRLVSRPTPDGPLTWPGPVMMTYARIPGTGVSILIDMRETRDVA